MGHGVYYVVCVSVCLNSWPIFDEICYERYSITFIVFLQIVIIWAVHPSRNCLSVVQDACPGGPGQPARNCRTYLLFFVIRQQVSSPANTASRNEELHHLYRSQ
jgi:hypothetical protein